jgi:hypothetical protein
MANRNGSAMTVSEMASLGGKKRWEGVPDDERTALTRLWGLRGAKARWGRKPKRRKKKARPKK